MRTSRKDKILATTPEAGVVLADLAELARSYVAGGYPMWTQLSVSLPGYIDDLEREFRPEVYRRMMRDPMVRGSVNVLRLRAVENDLGFLPALDPPTSSRATQSELAAYQLSREVRDFVERAHQDMQRDVEDVAFEMFQALPYGHRLAEQVLRSQLHGPDAGWLVLDALEPKPRQNYAFIVDQSNRLMGAVAAMPGISLTVPTGTGGYYQDLPNFMGLEKWFVLTNGGENNDPRGESVLNASYHAWWQKQQIWPQLLRYIVQFAGPSLIGYTPIEMAGTAPGQSGPRAVTPLGQPGASSPEDLMLQALELFQNQSIIVLRGGSKLDKIESTGEGRAHLATIDMLNREIVYGILMQTRATMEARNGSKADSDSATDVLDVYVRWLQRWFQRAYRKQVLRPLVSYRYGVEIAQLYTPRPMLMQVAQPDFPAEATAVAQLQSSGYLHPSQYPELDDRLGLPERDMDAVMAEIRRSISDARARARLLDTAA